MWKPVQLNKSTAHGPSKDRGKRTASVPRTGGTYIRSLWKRCIATSIASQIENLGLLKGIFYFASFLDIYFLFFLGFLSKSNKNAASPVSGDLFQWVVGFICLIPWHSDDSMGPGKCQKASWKGDRSKSMKQMATKTSLLVLFLPSFCCSSHSIIVFICIYVCVINDLILLSAIWGGRNLFLFRLVKRRPYWSTRQNGPEFAAGSWLMKLKGCDHEASH